jgi:predicted CoA-binding protein
MSTTDFSDHLLRAILASVKTIAIVGASANRSRPVFLVMKYLLSKGFNVIPVNPGQAGGEILGKTVYARLGDIPEAVDMVDIFRRPDAVPGIIDEALALETPAEGDLDATRHPPRGGGGQGGGGRVDGDHGSLPQDRVRPPRGRELLGRHQLACHRLAAAGGDSRVPAL